MPNCTILVGPPGSGKSTYVERIYNNMAAQVASTDDIIESIADVFNTTYDAIFNDAITLATNLFFRQLNQFGMLGCDIIVDRTNMTVKSRRKVMEKLKPYGYDFTAIIFEPPEKKEWDRRLDQRHGKFIPPGVIKSMMKSYQVPTKEEVFDKIFRANGVSPLDQYLETIL